MGRGEVTGVGFLVVAAMMRLVVPSTAAAQELRAAIVPDTARVGDVVLAAVRVDLPAEWQAEFPDSLAVTGVLENAGRPRETVDSLPGGARRVTTVYPITAWRPGPAALPSVSVRLIGPDGARTARTALPALTVQSVLPTDTAGIEPQPAKGVLGANWLLWPFLLGLVGIIASAAGVGYWLRRRRGLVELPLAPAAPPRAQALAALDRARALGLVEVGEFKAFYSLVSEAVRRYLEALDPAWGADLTTSQLIERFGRTADTDTTGVLDRLLFAADLVKFARREPTQAEAFGEWGALRTWVEALEQRLPWLAQQPAAGDGTAASPSAATDAESGRAQTEDALGAGEAA